MKKKRMENKMQDGFDTRFERWFLNRFGKDYRDTYFMGDMYDFIASEISKAREEGCQKGWEEGFKRCNRGWSSYLN